MNTSEAELFAVLHEKPVNKMNEHEFYIEAVSVLSDIISRMPDNAMKLLFISFYIMALIPFHTVRTPHTDRLD